MIADVTMAFAVAIIIELLSLSVFDFENLKQFVVFMFCFPIVLVYFINGCQINFIGKMDFAIWVIFVIMFDTVLVLLEKVIKNHIKE
jgi:hypothetical protein